MKAVFQIMKEQALHLHLIFRLALFEIKSTYQLHYLGIFWQILNPASRIFVYWLVFGLGIRGGEPVGEIPFFIWLILGLIPWLFISPAIIQGSNSIFAKISLVSKMKFPISVMPSVAIISNSFNFLILLALLMVLLIVYGINPGIYLLQLPYYLAALYLFLFSVTLLFSTISAVFRDFQSILQSLMRMMVYVLPILWDVSSLASPWLQILKLNPLFYLIQGFRSTLLGGAWFYEDITYTIYFWTITLVILLVGSMLHMKFRNRFIDYL
ncbi:ABC transporter permease [Bacillus infantis]|uniref:ABC transporter permease n=1 Tax=Bacillus infantis TaxID=324767 RepID=UPI002FBE49DC